MNNFFDVFISYGRADSKDFAIKLHNRLTEQGLKVWFDQNDIPLAVDFQEEIYDGIDKAHNFLFIISPYSVNSEYCFKEIQGAVENNKRIIPLLHVEEISKETWLKTRNSQKGTDAEWEEYKAKKLHSSHPNMPPAISKINWVYFRENKDNFEKSFKDLVNSIHKHADYVKQHSNFLVKALEWSRNQKQTNYLLIGEEREEAESWLKRRFEDEQPPCIPTDLHCEFICESAKNANNLMTQLFIAFSEKDRDIKDKISKNLMREGLTIWINKTDIKTGTEFQEEINKGIEGADNFVYLMSSNSLESKYCQQEIEHAFANNKRIIPLLIEDTETQQIPSQLRGLQFIDFARHEEPEKYRTSVDKLLNELKKDAVYYEDHKILLVKSLKWQRQNCNPSLLLRGYNLQHFEAWLKIAKQRQDHPHLPIQSEFIATSSRQPTDSALEVFISYSRADSDLARQLNDALQELGKTTWFDQESIASGTDFKQEIYRGIESSDNFLFIISSKSVNSPYCSDEVEYAQKLNKRIVTILHQEVSVEALHPALAKVQWLDFNKHGGDFYGNFNKLVRTIDTDREYVRSHTKWSQRAREWEQRDKSNDLLLRGSQFSLAQNWLQEASEQNKQPAPTSLQKEFIDKSKKAIEAAEEEKRQRQVQILRLQKERAQEAEARLAEEKKSARRQKLFLAAVSTALVFAVSGIVGTVLMYQNAKRHLENQINALSRASEALRDSNKEFDALIFALRAGRPLENQKVKSETKLRVVNGLQGAIDEVRERNRFSGHNKPVYSVSFSPDGDIIATASGDKTVKLWNLAGEELETLTGHEGLIWSISFSPDGKTIATASRDKTVKLWSRDGKLLKTLRGSKTPGYGNSGEFTSVSFSPDGKTIAAGNGNGTVQLWDIDGQELPTLTLTGHKIAVWSVSFSPDGQTIATGSTDGTVKLWRQDEQEPKTWKEIKSWKAHKKWLWRVRFSPDGQTIATASNDKTVKLWNLEGKKLHTLSKHEDKVLEVSFSPDGQTIATASTNGEVKLWSKDGQELKTLKGHDNWVWSVSFSPDSQTLATGSKDTTVKLWSWNRDDQELQTLRGYDKPVTRVSFSPDGQTIATGSQDGTVKLWSKDGRELLTFPGHDQSILGISFSPDGQTIATGSQDGTVKLWNLEGKELKTLSGPGDKVFSVSFSRDGTLAAASGNGRVKLWSKDGQELKTWSGHNNIIRSVSFSPDGQTLATASGDGTVKLWSREGKELQTQNLPRHNDWVLQVSFSPDGKTIATASSDKTVKLWNLEGKELATLSGHKGLVYSVSFSPDGQTLATASEDKTVKLWSLDGRQLQTLEQHKGSVTSVSFSPDGKTLATASNDKSVILWNLDLEKLASLHNLTLNDLMGKACDWVGDYLKHNPDVEKSDKQLCDGI
ncbi:MAG: TIR domain-containing protein [Xenococcaceae cyanobacterium]